MDKQKYFKKRVITEVVKLKGQIQVFHASWENNGDDDNYNTYIHTYLCKAQEWFH